MTKPKRIFIFSYVFAVLIVLVVAGPCLWFFFGDSIREYARRVGMPGDEFYKVATTVVVRSDAAKDQAGGLIKTGPPADPVRRWVSNRA